MAAMANTAAMIVLDLLICASPCVSTRWAVGLPTDLFDRRCQPLIARYPELSKTINAITKTATKVGEIF